MTYQLEPVEIPGITYWRVYLPNGDTAGTVVQRDFGFVGTPSGQPGESFNTRERAAEFVAGVAKYA